MKTKTLTSSLKLQFNNLLDVPTNIIRSIVNEEFYEVQAEPFKLDEAIGYIHIMNSVGKLYTKDSEFAFVLEDGRIFYLKATY